MGFGLSMVTLWRTAKRPGPQMRIVGSIATMRLGSVSEEVSREGFGWRDPYPHGVKETLYNFLPSTRSW